MVDYHFVMNTNSEKVRSAGGAQGLPRKYVLSEDVYQRETEHIFSKNWICVARVEELNSESHCLPLEFESHRFFLTQDECGTIRAFRNFCRHRGSQLVNEKNCASLGKRIQCPYHAWTYDRAGKLVSAPNMDDVPQFQAPEHGLIEIACQTKGGFVWINLEPQQSLDPWLAPIADRFVDWRTDELRIAHEIKYVVHANWKLIFQMAFNLFQLTAICQTKFEVKRSQLDLSSFESQICFDSLYVILGGRIFQLGLSKCE